MPSIENTFKCILDYRKGSVEDLRPGTLGMNVLYVLDVTQSGIFRSTSGFIPETCAGAFSRISGHIKIHELDKEIELTVDGKDLCTFTIGATFYSM